MVAGSIIECRCRKKKKQKKEREKKKRGEKRESKPPSIPSLHSSFWRSRRRTVKES
jgi:hypothetical protein